MPAARVQSRSLFRRVRMRGAILAAAASAFLSRRAGFHATALPGLVAERIEPDILAELRAGLGPVVVVLGTNGKTTTTRLIARILAVVGPEPVTNRSGANLRQGIVTSLLSSRRRGAGSTRRPGVFEVDELALSGVVRALRPDVVVILNLLRDQLDRYGELDAVEDRLVGDLTGLPASTAVVICADDPRLESLAERVATRRPGAAPVVRFGLIPESTDAPGSRDAEPDRGGLGTSGSTGCPRCGAPLAFEGTSRAGLGAWACPACGTRRARIDLGVGIDGVDGDGWLRLRFAARYPTGGSAKPGPIRVRLTGTAGAYDVAAAALAAMQLGISPQSSVMALDRATPAFGRLEEVVVGDRSVILTLAKNPASFAQAAEAAAVRQPDSLLIALGDRAADGRDVSWIWDAELDRLPDDPPLTLSGARAEDLAVRFKYAADAERGRRAPDAITVDHVLERAVDAALERVGSGGTLMVLATYTSLLDVRQRLRRLAAAAA